MAWFKRKEKGITTATEDKKDVPKGLWYKSPTGKIVDSDELERNLWVSPEDDYHVRIGSAEYFQILFDNNEFEELDANDKKRFNLKSGIKIKQVTNEDYKEYAEYLKGSIVTQVDNMRAVDMESVSAYLAKKEVTEKTHYQILAKNGQIYRFFL